MRKKRLLAIVLLSLSFCFVSGVGYGEIEEFLLEITTRRVLETYLIDARVSYIMASPDSFLRVSYSYDPLGNWAKNFPAGVSTRGKIYVAVIDSRDVFLGKTGETLLRELQNQGWYVCYNIRSFVSDAENDIVIRFMDGWGEPLGYFYQGEYHLWDE